jgi:NAD(P)-dependent dehydrogenase (short-subunit alcohol dehydrogenase family)
MNSSPLNNHCVMTEKPDSVAPVALILGASRGIGRATARALAASGWALDLIGRNEGALAGLAATLPGTGHRHLGVDLTGATGRDHLSDWLGPNAPQAIVQCIGGRVPDDSPDPWGAALSLNLQTGVAMTERLIPRMLSRGTGTVVHVSSSAAVHGRAFTPYAAAKAALNRYIVNRGRECLPLGVVITGLMPAAVEGDENEWARTRTTDPERYARMCQGQALGRPQTTDEVAAAIAFLCSPAARIFGGCVLAADAAIG